MFGSIGNVTGAIKEKLGGGSAKEQQQKLEPGKVVIVEKGDEGKVKELVVEGTEADELGGTLKAAEQMGGQTFNDVGKIGGEGTGRHRKM